MTENKIKGKDDFQLILDIKPPLIAYPTIILCVFNLLFYFVVQYFYSLGVLPYWLCFPLWTISGYISFTPMHEAVHSSVASKKSGCYYLNNFIGVLSSSNLGFVYREFKYVHLSHHKYTNLNNANDPDLFTSSHSEKYYFLLPFKLVMQYLYYFYWIHKYEHIDKIYVPFVERWAYRLFMFYGIFFQPLLFFGRYWCPAVVAAAMLAFVFNYLPHRPHTETSRYKLAKNMYLNFPFAFGKKSAKNYGILTVLFLYQNYHHIHHLFPFVPFYYYSRIWQKHKKTLKQHGASEQPLFPIFATN